MTEFNTGFKGVMAIMDEIFARLPVKTEIPNPGEIWEYIVLMYDSTTNTQWIEKSKFFVLKCFPDGSPEPYTLKVVWADPTLRYGRVNNTIMFYSKNFKNFRKIRNY